MKKRSLLILLSLLLCSLTLFAVGCTPDDVQTGIDNNKKTLSAPSGLRVEAGSLKWNPVEYASKYTVSVDGKEDYCVDYTYPLNNLRDGEHVFKVKANGDGILYESSAWSNELKETIAEGVKASTGYYGQFDELTKKESFLGYGFDIINSAVFSDKYVLTSFPIFNTDELMDLRLLKVDSKQSYVEEMKSSSMEDFLQQWNVSAKVNVSWGKKRIGGSVSVSAKYSGGVEHAKSKYYHCVSIYNQKFYIVLQSDIDTYKSILSQGFENDLYSDMSPADLFSKYGTHFITSAVMGGKINSYYLYSSEEEKSYNNISAKVSTEVRAFPTKVNVDVSGGYKETAKSENIDVKNTLEVIGGGDFGMLSDEDIPANYANWEKSLDDHASLMGIKDASSLIPIWQLIDTSKDSRTYSWIDEEGNSKTGTRAEQLQAYFLKYGIDSYNELMTVSGLPEIIMPEEIVNVKVNGLDAVNDEYEVYVGDNNISFGYTPDNATGFTKNASIASSTEYAETDQKNSLTIKIATGCPNDTVLDVILSYGNVRKTIKLRVIKRYTVTFNSNGGTAVSAYKNIVHGSQIIAPTAPVREGYVFKGWYKDYNFAEDSKYVFGSDAVVDNMTLYAKWEEYHPTVTVKHNVPGKADDKYKTEYKGKCPLSLTPEEYGYSFIGYYSDEEMLLSFDTETTFVSDGTIYAKWQALDYTLSFISDGVTACPSQTVKYNEKATRPNDPAKSGHTFTGWYVDEGASALFDFASDRIVKDTVLYAGWTENPVCEVVFDVKGGEPVDSVIVEEGSSLGQNVPTPEYIGHEFKGWFLDEEYTSRLYSTTKIYNSTTVYAKWEKLYFSVTLNLNGGTLADDNLTGYSSTDGADLPEVFRNGYEFEGWFDETDVKWETIPVGTTGDLLLTAQWRSLYVRIDGSGNESATGGYILFGEYPQTVKADSVTITSTTDSRGYYLGSDGAYYAKVTAKPYNSSYTFTTGTTIVSGKVYYFKVEPIKWRILEDDDGTATILCEMIIDAHADQRSYTNNSGTYYTTANGAPDGTYANNYEYSEIRKWLNENFYETAFSELEKGVINTVQVDNSAKSTMPYGVTLNDGVNNYACADTYDKVWLMSEEEMTKSWKYVNYASSYTYDTQRRKQTTDYAKANRAYTNTSSDYYGNGYWWLRSPDYGSSHYSRDVFYVGSAGNGGLVTSSNIGVVPALQIRLRSE